MAFWIPLSRSLALEPSVGAFVPFLRYQFTYTDEAAQEQAVYRSPPIALMLEFAISLRIP